VKIHSAILAEKMTPSQFKFFVGAIILANPPGTKLAGTVDLSVRQLSNVLQMSPTEVWRRERELADKGMVQITPNGIVVTNYDKYQGKKGVSPAKQSKIKGESQAQSVSPAEQLALLDDVAGVSPAEQGDKKIKDTSHQEKPDALATKINDIFIEIEKRRGHKSTAAKGEAVATTLMLKDGYSVQQILSCYDKMKKDKFWKTKTVSLTTVRQQIGAVIGPPHAGGEDGTSSGNPHPYGNYKEKFGKPIA
jgi:DNA-binding Lrp family transcriptional regulator